MSCTSSLIPDSDNNISDILVSSGYPHVAVSATTRHLAFECCLLHEVFTKRLAALDDIRKGLATVKTHGISILDLVLTYPDLEKHMFPSYTAKVDVNVLKYHLEYETPYNEKTTNACQYFEEYLEEVNKRG